MWIQIHYIQKWSMWVLIQKESMWVLIHRGRERGTTYCICSVISSFSNLNRWSSSLGLLCNVPLKRDECDWDWRLRFNDISDAIGYSYCIFTNMHSQHVVATTCRLKKYVTSHIWMSHVMQIGTLSNGVG